MTPTVATAMTVAVATSPVMAAATGPAVATTPVMAAAMTSGSPGPWPGNHLADVVATLAHPWPLAAMATALSALAAGLRSAIHSWRHTRLITHAHQVSITPPPEVDPTAALAWWANIGGLLTPGWWRRLLFGTPHLGIEYRWTGRRMQIIVWVPGTVPAGPVAAAVRAAWPGAATAIDPATAPLTNGHSAQPVGGQRDGHLHDQVAQPDGQPVGQQGGQQGGQPSARPGVATREAGGALAPALPPWYPLATEHATDPMRPLIAAGASLHATEAACLQVLARPASPRQITRLRAGAAALKTGRHPSTGFGPERALRLALDLITDLVTPTPAHRTPGTARATSYGSDPLRERDARAGIDKVLGPQWEVAIRYAVTHTITRPTRAKITEPAGRDDDVIGRRLTTLTHQLVASFAIHTARNHYRTLRVTHPTTVLANRAFRTGFLLSAPELATLAGLPTDLSVAGLDRARARAVPTPITVPAGGRGTKVLGRSEAGNHSVALPVVDARQHLHVLGSTGVGKSTLLAHLILDDIRAHRGVVLIDPKGDLALDVMDRLPTDAIPRLVLIDPDQPAGGATFNPLERRRGQGAEADVIVDNIVAIFANIFQRHWGPRIDDVMRVSCLTLMRHPGPTLVNVVPLLNNKQFRAPMTVDLDDPEGLKGFWEWFESTPAALRSQVIGPVLARLRSFLLRDFVRALLGPARSSFDMGTVLDGGILIARLPKGQLGEDAARLLGSFVLASVWQAATARARQPEQKRRDASVYVDEAHGILNLAGSVADMLAEARAYHLSLILAHQDLAQLPRDTQLALSANARNKIIFNCSPEDAKQLARHTLPELDEHDLSHLDAYTAAARLMIANRETAAFTLRTNPPRPPTADREQIRDAIARTAPTARNTEPTDERLATTPSSPDASQDSDPEPLAACSAPALPERPVQPSTKPAAAPDSLSTGERCLPASAKPSVPRGFGDAHPTPRSTAWFRTRR